MTEQDSNLILSALSQQFTEDDITVQVDIYRLEEEDGWTLEVIDEDDISFVYEDLFETDQEAWDAFLADVEEYGLADIIDPDEDEDDDAPSYH
ncbi:hypothetical protein ACI0FM_00260 [Paenochrobactrum sp. BZR 588]|uniref:hypothetical protein n=1 Tax=unclassified Paenochrobactrum TaxID=2639760 RepID=UPI0038552BC6